MASILAGWGEVCLGACYWLQLTTASFFLVSFLPSCVGRLNLGSLTGPVVACLVGCPQHAHFGHATTKAHPAPYCCVTGRRTCARCSCRCQQTPCCGFACNLQMLEAPATGVVAVALQLAVQCALRHMTQVALWVALLLLLFPLTHMTTLQCSHCK